MQAEPLLLEGAVCHILVTERRGYSHWWLVHVRRTRQHLISPTYGSDSSLLLWEKSIRVAVPGRNPPVLLHKPYWTDRL